LRWYHTFVRLTPEERKFVDAYRLAAHKASRRRRPPTLELAVRMIIRDYQRMLNEHHDEQLIAKAREALNELERTQEGAPAE
jgi:hypothetical protein